ncbi:hypothetical protein CF319_g8249 [Tilletia indica]|nr:hypothetical protein CF319_g8249 [Tilletia indica]
MDGTFGVSSTKVLLFIILTVDKNNKGMPIGYLLVMEADDASLLVKLSETSSHIGRSDLHFHKISRPSLG